MRVMSLEIFGYDFMQRALLSGAVTAVLCSVIGVFLVLRRYSLFGDAMAHSAFGGVALGLLIGIYPLWMAYIFSIISAVTITRLREKFDISGDAAIAVLLSSGIAVALVMISLSGGFSIDIFSFLFGSILLVSINDTILVLAMTGGILMIVIVLFQQILYSTFDEKQAKVSGINVVRINYLLILMAGLTVVTAIQLVGVLLISALFVIPNVTAMMLGKGFKMTLVLSIMISVSSVISGIMLSYVFDITPAGCIVLLLIAVLACVMAAKSKQLLVRREQTV